MTETEIVLSVLTAALVGVTVLVWRATVKVANATEKVAEVTRETTKLGMMPRMSILFHTKLEGDTEHDHYEFTLKNEGVGDCFDLQFEIFNKTGSTVVPTIHSVGINATTRIIDRNVDRGAQTVKIKLNYRDYAENQYSKEILYDLRSNSGSDFHLTVVHPD